MWRKPARRDLSQRLLPRGHAEVSDTDQCEVSGKGPKGEIPRTSRCFPLCSPITDIAQISGQTIAGQNPPLSAVVESRQNAGVPDKPEIADNGAFAGSRRSLMVAAHNGPRGTQMDVFAAEPYEELPRASGPLRGFPL